MCQNAFFDVKVWLGFSRTNADSQWNPVYDAFHRIFCFGNETIRRQFCKRDLDAANLRPALENYLLYVPNIKM